MLRNFARLQINKINDREGNLQMKIETQEFPIISLKEVIHIGTLNGKDKLPNSLEGAGLSVSLHPDEWQAIAKLGGNSRFRLSKEKSSFLNIHQLTDEQREMIAEWGILNGYIEKSTVYFYTWIDGETEEEMIFETSDYEEAVKGAECNEEVVKAKFGYKATPKLEKETIFHNIPPFLTVSLLATLYAEVVLDYDGVWWDDVLDHWSLSAPRGVISSNKLNEWEITKIT
jgi:hypothetical protein